LRLHNEKQKTKYTKRIGKNILGFGFFRDSVLRFYDGIWEGKDVEKWSPPQAQGGGIQSQQEEHQPSHPCVLTKKMGPSGKAFETSALLLACSLASVTCLQISGTGHCRLCPSITNW
jgi:hypothetical protein